MTNVIDKHDLTPDQQAMLAIWQQHTHAEFGLNALHNLIRARGELQ
jgi:hypothetical protein